MSWAKLDIGAAEPLLNEDQFARIVPFDRVADELQDIPDHERDQRPMGRVLVVPHQKMDRQHERHGESDDMKKAVAGVQMTFGIILQEAFHEELNSMTESNDVG